MHLAKSESPRVVHLNAIHYTNLLSGVRVNHTNWMIAESENRHHIQTICRQIAEEFFLNTRSSVFCSL